MTINNLQILRLWCLKHVAADIWLGSGLAARLHNARMVRDCRRAGISDPVAHLRANDWM